MRNVIVIAVLLFFLADIKAIIPALNEIVSTQDILAGDVFFEITEPSELEYTYRLRPAKDFGVAFRKRLANVALVPTVPADACSELRNGRDVRSNVALMSRGECSFIKKTIMAERAGAQAAIITEFNNESSEFDYYIEMVHDNSTRVTNIPAGFLLGKNGLVIRSTLKRLKMSHAVINLPINLTFIPPAKINHPPWLGW